jgi:hypothetical protein
MNIELNQEQRDYLESKIIREITEIGENLKRLSETLELINRNVIILKDDNIKQLDYLIIKSCSNLQRAYKDNIIYDEMDFELAKNEEKLISELLEILNTKV